MLTPSGGPWFPDAGMPPAHHPMGHPYHCLGTPGAAMLATGTGEIARGEVIECQTSEIGLRAAVCSWLGP